MVKGRYVSFAVVLAAFALVAGMTFGARSIAAQDTGTPAAEGMMAADHPAHIHTGTCDAVGDVIHPLENLVAPDMAMAGTPEAGMAEGTPEDDMSGMEHEDMGEVVAESTTTVTATFDELTGADHVINVHESEANIGNYIACGAITGTASAEGVLEIELAEQNDSGLEGKATLTDNGDGTIDVHAQLWNVMDAGMGTPEASPTS